MSMFNEEEKHTVRNAPRVTWVTRGWKVLAERAGGGAGAHARTSSDAGLGRLGGDLPFVSAAQAPGLYQVLHRRAILSHSAAVWLFLLSLLFYR